MHSETTLWDQATSPDTWVGQDGVCPTEVISFGAEEAADKGPEPLITLMSPEAGLRSGRLKLDAEVSCRMVLSRQSPYNTVQTHASVSPGGSAGDLSSLKAEVSQGSFLPGREAQPWFPQVLCWCCDGSRLLGTARCQTISKETWKTCTTLGAHPYGSISELGGDSWPCDRPITAPCRCPYLHHSVMHTLLMPSAPLPREQPKKPFLQG